MTIHIRINGDSDEQYAHLDRMGEAIAEFVNSGGFMKIDFFNSHEENVLTVERYHEMYTDNVVPSLWHRIHRISPGFLRSEVMITVAPRYPEKEKQP